MVIELVFRFDLDCAITKKVFVSDQYLQWTIDPLWTWITLWVLIYNGAYGTYMNYDRGAMRAYFFQNYPGRQPWVLLEPKRHYKLLTKKAKKHPTDMPFNFYKPENIIEHVLEIFIIFAWRVRVYMPLFVSFTGFPAPWNTPLTDSFSVSCHTRCVSGRATSKFGFSRSNYPFSLQSFQLSGKVSRLISFSFLKATNIDFENRP